MKLSKIIVFLTAVTCVLSSFTACGSENSKETAQVKAPTVAGNDTAQTQVSVKKDVSDTSKKSDSETVRKPAAITPPDTSAVPKFNKAFKLMGHSSTITLDSRWEITSGASISDQQSNSINSFPAVIQYLNKNTTITIDVKNEVTSVDEETYIEDYGKDYDSINITQFKSLKIHEYDSFEIKADVVVNGESFKMTHVISNNVNEKTFSWLMLDCDGSCDDFNIPDAIYYPRDITKNENYKKIEERMKKIEEFKNRDLDSYYKFNVDDFR